jgi:hypothetical protein
MIACASDLWTVLGLGAGAFLCLAGLALLIWAVER